MKTQGIGWITWGAALLLFLSGGNVRAQGPAPQGETPVSPEAPLGTRFTYQGKLQRDGNPVSDTCDTRFTLYDSDRRHTGRYTCGMVRGGGQRRPFYRRAGLWQRRFPRRWCTRSTCP